MTDLPKPNKLAALQARQDTADVTKRLDEVVGNHGYARGERRGGRKPSPRTGQLHPKVLPEIAQAITDEAARLGTTQGHVIEWMWATWLEQGKPTTR